MKPKETIAGFDKFLEERGLSFEAIVIGGAALGLLGVVSRQTRDCDILHPKLARAIEDAAVEYAEMRRREGDMLAADWLNNGPSSLADVLPWLEDQDANPDWPAHARATVEDLLTRLGHGV